MARMTRVSPPELERALPGPQASKSVTCAPRRRRWRAVQPPKAPAPTTAMRGGVAAINARAAIGSAATLPMNALREIPVIGCALERDARAHTDRAWLIGEVADARARTALLIQRQERALVGDVVDEERRVPVVPQDAEAEVKDVVRRQLRIERERALRERAADAEEVRVVERIQVHRTEARRLIRDLRVAVAHVLVHAGEV